VCVRPPYGSPAARGKGTRMHHERAAHALFINSSQFERCPPPRCALLRQITSPSSRFLHWILFGSSSRVSSRGRALPAWEPGVYRLVFHPPFSFGSSDGKGKRQTFQRIAGERGKGLISRLSDSSLSSCFRRSFPFDVRAGNAYDFQFFK